MQRITFVILLANMAASAYGGTIMPRHVTELDGRIVGGEEASISEFPYLVSLRVFGLHTCGGSILSPRTVVTAAHCVFTSASAYSVQYGSTSKNGSNNIIKAQQLIVHPNYSSTGSNYDVAVIILASDIPFSATVQPITLAAVPPAPGTHAVVAGWGTTSAGGASPTNLRKVTVQIVDSAQCQLEYAKVNIITPAMLCAGVPNGGKDACQGDSGGPLTDSGALVGIVSWGVSCALPDYSGVYANVAEANIMDFIKSNTY